MKKTKKANYVTLTEFASAAGVTVPAASLWLKSQKLKGFELTKPSGRRGVNVDLNNPLIQNYIKNTFGKSVRSKDSFKKNEDVLRKLQFRAEKMRLENVALREKYISREDVVQFLDKLLEVEEKVFKNFPENILKKIEKKLKIKITTDSRRRAKKFMDETISHAHSANCRIVADFKKANAVKYENT